MGQSYAPSEPDTSTFWMPVARRQYCCTFTGRPSWAVFGYRPPKICSHWVLMANVPWVCIRKGPLTFRSQGCWFPQSCNWYYPFWLTFCFCPVVKAAIKFWRLWLGNRSHRFLWLTSSAVDDRDHFLLCMSVLVIAKLDSYCIQIAMAVCASMTKTNCCACICKTPCQLSSLSHMDCMHMWLPEMCIFLS